MALQKQNVQVPFAQGLDTKTDPWQVSLGRFLALENGVFGTGNLLAKRNAFSLLTTLPSGSEATTLTTFKGNLTAIGTRLLAYNASSRDWEDKGRIQPISLSVQPLSRSPYTQKSQDVAISSGGLACTVFLDGDGKYKYQINDYATGQTLVNITELQTGALFARSFTLGRYFIITYIIDVAGTVHLRYIAIPLTNISNPGSPVDLSSDVLNVSSGYDGCVANNNLYVAWEGSAGGGTVKVSYIDSTLAQHGTVTNAGHGASLMSVVADTTASTAKIWVTAYKANNAYTYAYNQILVPTLAATHTINTITVIALTGVASSGLTLFYEVSNTYSFSSVRSDYIQSVTCSPAGVVGSPAVVIRSVGLGSKAFFVGTTAYMLSIYGGTYQPTYFLNDEDGNVIAKFAYSNASGYIINQILPSAMVTGNQVQIGYLFADQISPVNKSQTALSSTGVYVQTGVNLITFDLSSANLITAEIGNNLHIPGGIMWAYDGVKAVEQGFNVWPEDVKVASDATSGSMSHQQYFYQVTYEWTDGQGNLHRSAPSVPATVTLSSTSSVRIDVPTLRLTYKVAPNGVRIVIYRWSAAQQNYYQTTSITSPLLNNPSVDSVFYIDTHSDAQIVGNSLIYTTGGVVENIAPPSPAAMALYKNRLFLINNEDKDSVWYSKIVLESTPVEFSDGFTRFISPTSGAQGSTGSLFALAPMDDKLIFFKRDAEYYMTGNGPDITGANDDFSEPIFITSVTGTTNQNSVVSTPNGLMFQSDKGIWLLGRNLATSYQGAAVESFNNQVIHASACIPGTNQVRFLLESGTSNTLYTGLHTVLNQYGQVLQEQLSNYIDGGKLGTLLMYDYYYDQWGTFDVSAGPVLISFTTAWAALTGLQGFQRAYWVNLLSNFITPHKLQVGVAHDYNDSPTQQLVIIPDNYSLPYGEDPIYGTASPYGGPSTVEQYQIFLNKQKCQSVQISIQEIADNQYGTMNGPGLTFSGLNFVVGLKKGYPAVRATRQVS